jgi:hypothetical protein
MAPSTKPSARKGHAMTYDSESDRAILFGGLDGSVYGDTWAYDFNTNTWQNMAPSVAPSARYGHAIVYDSESDVVILFGGYDGTDYLGDTWAYDYNTNTWTNMGPIGAPSARYLHAMAYDSESDHVILFGGSGGSGDTWSYDYNTNTWTNMVPGVAPSARIAHAMVYDVDGDRAFLFGGSAGGTYLSDTWSYDFNINLWESLIPITQPYPRYRPAMAYNIDNSCITLFGGHKEASSYYFDDTWAYIFEQKNVTALVSFYDGDPAYGGSLIGQQNITVWGNGSATATCDWLVTAGHHDIYVVISNVTPGDADWSNNVAFKSVDVLPDFCVLPSDISFSNPTPTVGETVLINVTITNLGTALGNATVKFWDRDPTNASNPATQIGSDILITLPPDALQNVSVEWTAPPVAKNYSIFVTIENVEPNDLDLSNNMANKTVEVISPPTDKPDLSITSSDIWFDHPNPSKATL